MADPASVEEILPRLRELVDEALAKGGEEPLDPAFEADAFLADVFQSVVFVRLIPLVEKEWNIEIDEDSIELENFETLRSIARLISEIRAKLHPRG